MTQLKYCNSILYNWMDRIFPTTRAGLDRLCLFKVISKLYFFAFLIDDMFSLEVFKRHQLYLICQEFAIQLSHSRRFHRFLVSFSFHTRHSTNARVQWKRNKKLNWNTDVVLLLEIQIQRLYFILDIFSHKTVGVAS